MLTQKELKEILHYDPETGLFIWLITPGIRVKSGSVAGCAKNGYIAIRIKGKAYLAHRLAWLYMTGEFPPKEIDHNKHDKSDNRFSEINLASHTENGRNLSLNKKNTSGVMGVYLNKAARKWQAYITVNKKRIYLGIYEDKNNAIKARKSAEQKYGFHENHGK